MVKDITEKELPAVDIFAHAIKYLKDHLLEENTTQGTTIKDTDINWVLTVPAIWDDPAKQFMRKAAEKVTLQLHVFDVFVSIIFFNKSAYQ